MRVIIIALLGNCIGNIFALSGGAPNFEKWRSNAIDFAADVSNELSVINQGDSRLCSKLGIQTIASARDDVLNDFDYCNEQARNNAFGWENCFYKREQIFHNKVVNTRSKMIEICSKNMCLFFAALQRQPRSKLSSDCFYHSTRDIYVEMASRCTFMASQVKTKERYVHDLDDFTNEKSIGSDCMKPALSAMKKSIKEVWKSFDDCRESISKEIQNPSDHRCLYWDAIEGGRQRMKECCKESLETFQYSFDDSTTKIDPSCL